MNGKKSVLEAKFLSNPSYVLHSHRCVSSFIPEQNYERMLRFEKNERVFYITSDKIDNIYDFLFKCRVTKEIIPRYCFGEFENSEQAEKASVEIYHLASGNKLPQNIDMKTKLLIHRYLFYGLVYLRLFSQRNLGDRDTEDEEKNHFFNKNDAWALDMNGLFIGLIIDYYDIDPGISMMNSQNAFMTNSKYRESVFENIKETYMKFVRENTEKFKGDMELNEIIAESIKILTNYIK